MDFERMEQGSYSLQLFAKISMNELLEKEYAEFQQLL